MEILKDPVYPVLIVVLIVVVGLTVKAIITRKKQPLVPAEVNTVVPEVTPNSKEALA